MSDGLVYCKQCKEMTEHTHLNGRSCACSACGAVNYAKQVEKILANIEERKAATAASLAKARRTVDVDAEAPGDLILTTHGEIKMKQNRVKLTEEQKAEIVRRGAAGEKDSALAAEFGVKQNKIWYVKQIAKRRESKKGKRAALDSALSNISIAAPVIVPENPGNPLRDLIAREVSGHLADLDRRIDIKVREVLAEMLK